VGASGWQHFVPYDLDPARALEGLRDEVFRSGKYYWRAGVARPTTLKALLARADEDGTHSVLDVSRVVTTPLPEPTLSWQRDVLARTGAPPPPDELRRRMLEQLKYIGVVAPISDAQLVATLGSSRPDHAAVEAGAYALSSRIPRGCATYVVVYDASGIPSELFFSGVTGD